MIEVRFTCEELEKLQQILANWRAQCELERDFEEISKIHEIEIKLIRASLSEFE